MFLFSGGQLGGDLLTGFEPGRDTVRIASPRAEGFADLRQRTLGGDAAVPRDRATAIFEGIAPGSLRAADFAFF